MGRHYGLYHDYVDDELDRHRSHYSNAIVFGDLLCPTPSAIALPCLRSVTSV